MSRRVDHHPDMLLGLVLGQGRARLNRPGDGRAEILDGDVQMDGGVLPAWLARPHRPCWCWKMASPNTGRKWFSKNGPNVAIVSSASTFRSRGW